jgi:uncharacterized protein Veg
LYLTVLNLVMIKVQKSNQEVNPFGGLNFISKSIKESMISDIIDNQLGSRGSRATYSYSDIFTALFMVFYAGGDRMEDIDENLKDKFNDVDDLLVPSPDTIGKGLIELTTEKEIHVNSEVVHEYNDNPELNKLLLKIQKELRLIESDNGYILDFDHQFIPTDKYDSKTSYKKKNGYFPGIASINDLPVYIENRNGNSNVKYLQHETILKIFKALEEEGIKIDKFRADAGSYIEKVIKLAEEYANTFYIRASKSDYMREEIMSIDKWELVEINNIIVEVASVDYSPFKGAKTYRLVIQRTINNEEEKQGNLFTNDARTYRAIITDDKDMSEKQVIEFYNARGTSEKIFDVMNNDFGWSKLPFSFMNQNTVFLIVMAIGRTIYQWLLNGISKVFKSLSPKSRLKKFIFKFVIVATKWIKKGRGKKKLIIYDKRPYEQLVRLE